MRIQYSLTFRDYFAFNLLHQFLLITNQLFFMAVATLIAIEEAMGYDGQRGVLAWIVAYAAMWALQVVYNLVVLRSKKDRALLTDHIVEALEDTFSDTTAFCASNYKWPGIVCAVSRPGFVAVYTAAHAACIIPNRAFADAQQRKAFLAHVRTKTAA
jgi:YcxB-like protein